MQIYHFFVEYETRCHIKSTYAFQSGGSNYWTWGAGHAKCLHANNYNDGDNKKFEAISDKYYVAGICSSGKCVQNGSLNNIINYFIFLVGLTK